MNFQSLLGVTVLVAGSLHLAQAQQSSDHSAIAPVPLPASPSHALFALPSALETSSPTSTDKYPVAAVNPRHESKQTLWYASIAAALGATAFDSASSWKKQEFNPLLASNNGTFGGRAISFKIGAAAVILLPQLILRKHKDLRTGFIIGNLTETAIFSAAAIHNLGLKQ